MANTDYTKGTGNGGLMLIRDTGWSIEMQIKAGSTSTWKNDIPFQVYINGVYHNGTFNYPTGAAWVTVYAENVSTTQSVEFYIGATGTSGLGGPTDFWQQINRAPAGGPPTIDSTYYADSITSSSFWAVNLIVNPNGGTLIDTQMQVNTAPTEAGSTLAQLGSFGNMWMGGLYRATVYYFRVRVANNTYGWGAWGEWRSFTTLALIPDAPNPVTLSANKQTSIYGVFAGGASDGGAGVDIWQISYGLDPVTPTNTFDSYVGTLTPLLPGRTYYFWARGHNRIGWSPYSERTSSRTIAGARVNVAGVWKEAIPYVRDGGVWKLAEGWAKIAGLWKGTG